MRPSRSRRPTVRLAFISALLSIGAAAACRDAVGPETIEARVARVEMRPFDQAIVDSPYVAPVRVSDGDGVALSGVAVRWIVPTNAGFGAP